MRSCQHQETLRFALGDTLGHRCEAAILQPTLQPEHVAQSEAKGLPQLARTQSSGFTLIELLLCLTLSAALILASFSLGQSSQRTRIEARSSELQAAVHYARNAALAKGRPILLAPLDGSKNWSNGLIACLDNPAHQCKDPDDTLYQWRWEGQGIELLWQGFISSDYILFSPQVRHATSSGHFCLISQGVEKIRITLNRIGHISVIRA